MHREDTEEQEQKGCTDTYVKPQKDKKILKCFQHMAVTEGCSPKLNICIKCVQACKWCNPRLLETLQFFLAQSQADIQAEYILVHTSLGNAQDL